MNYYFLLMSAVKVFEWADYEQTILSELELVLDADFTPEVYKYEAASGYHTISIFVDSQISADDLHRLYDSGLRRVVIRAAGCNMIDIQAAKEVGVEVYRVANYSPESIAEHAFALLLALQRKLMTEREHHQVLKNDRSSALMGSTLSGKTLGLYGVGKIGRLVAQIAAGFRMQILFYDKFIDALSGAGKVGSLGELFSSSDVVSVHVPLTPETRHTVNADVLQHSHPGLVLINTARGDIMDPEAVIQSLDAGQLGGLGVDVWDGGQVDDRFDQRLLRHNVIQTEHVGFFTREAVSELLSQSVENILGNGRPENLVKPDS